MTILTKAILAKITELAKIDVSIDQQELVLSKLNNVMAMNHKLSQLNTDAIEPLNNPLELTQPLRDDKAIETNQRDALQSIAPNIENALYLVPQVIETD